MHLKVAPGLVRLCKPSPPPSLLYRHCFWPAVSLYRTDPFEHFLIFFSAPYMRVGEYLRKATWSGSSTSSESECQRESLTLLIYGIVFHLKVAPPILQKQA